MHQQLISLGCLAILLSACGEPAQEVQPRLSMVERVRSADPAVCADVLLGEAALGQFKGHVDEVSLYWHDDERAIWVDEATLTLNQAVVGGQNPATGTMTCDADLIVRFRDQEWSTPVTWELQPLADGSDILVNPDLPAFGARFIPVIRAMQEIGATDAGSSSEERAREWVASVVAANE